MSAWQQGQLGDLCRFVGGQGFSPEFQGSQAGDVPFIKVSDMELPGNERRITAANNWVTYEVVSTARFKTQPVDSIVFAKIGEAIKRERVRLLTRPTIIDNNMMAAIPNLNTCTPGFLYYLFQFTPFSKDHGGTSLPYLRAGDMVNIGVSYPPLDEQQRIAGVLGAFDDLIETNRNTQRSMEALAHALFAREGFDALPSGDMVSLGEVIEVNPRVSKPKGQAPYVDMAALPADSALLGPASAREAAGGAKFHNGDTLLARITPCLENGKTAFVTNLPDQSTGVGSTEFIVLRGSRDTGSFWPYCLARSPRFRAFAIQQLGDGTSGRQRVSAGAVSEYVIPVPGQKPLRRFREAVEPLVEGMIALHEEALDLTRQRDKLLPLLMSGKVRVSDLEGVA
ncbi:restriction endonuclease subunit S [Propioniciclava soli]|uniref:restriction endonuclease subunit S n=1 Tax=Propioniciclava soli TaxID=2775081 RepID=UPI001E4C23E6